MRNWIKRIIQEALEEEFSRLRLRIRQLDEQLSLMKQYVVNIEDHNIQSSIKETTAKNVASNVQR